jgi:hypothetical protein
VQRTHKKSGQALLEFALVYVGVVVPLTFGIIFLSEMLWTWHSVVELNRDVARYAATHCYQGDTQNVISYMQTHVPRMIDQEQFQQGQATLAVNYFARDPDTGQLTPFSCDGDCSIDCIPDAVSVSIRDYQFKHFLDYLKLQPITIPPFTTSLPIESAGCDPQQGSCQP